MNEKGFTLTEVLIVSAIAGAFLLGLAASLEISQTSLTSFQRSLTPDELQQNLIRALDEPRSIAYTCANDAGFRKCFSTGNASCLGNQTYPLRLFDSLGVQIAGPANAPVYFTRENTACVGGLSVCDYKVTAEFRVQGHPADCGNGCELLLPRDYPPNNMLHEILVISFTIESSPLLSQSMPAVATRSGSVTIALDQVYGNIGGCPAP
jgi:prepilin-type N-terminal cleavage/methylation domain-containing protein